MTRDELSKLREELQTLVDSLRHLGDFDANAGNVRVSLECCLKLTQHLLDGMKK